MGCMQCELSKGLMCSMVNKFICVFGVCSTNGMTIIREEIDYEMFFHFVCVRVCVYGLQSTDFIGKELHGMTV